MEYGNRPNRSDVHLSKEEAAKIEEETRQHFDGIAPKRHSKPPRSEYKDDDDDDDDDDIISNNNIIPELVEFQRLESHPQELVYDGNKLPEEFVETEYYQDLNCVDKQHHTTGTGFIKMDDANGKSFSLAPDSTSCHESCKGNPATNDWIPAAAADTVSVVSDKPNRSEN